MRACTWRNAVNTDVYATSSVDIMITIQTNVFICEEFQMLLFTWRGCGIQVDYMAIDEDFFIYKDIFMYKEIFIYKDLLIYKDRCLLQDFVILLYIGLHSSWLFQVLTLRIL